MQISGRNFHPELCGEVHPETAPSKLCAVPFALQNRTEQRGQKGEKRRVKTGQYLKFEVQPSLRTNWGAKKEGAYKVGVATPAEPRGEKKTFLCKFWAVKNS